MPPFPLETAIQKVCMAEGGWNSRDLQRVALVAFLERKWAGEFDYRLIEELWAFGEDLIAVRFACEWHDDGGRWFRSYGNENWEFDVHGLMRRRSASINDQPIEETERRYH